MFVFNFIGTAFLDSGFNDDCQVPQGFVFTLKRSSKPFITNPLSDVIKPNSGLEYLQIYHSITGGQEVSAQDTNNNLRFLELKTQEIKGILLDVQTNVPELQSDTGKWEAVTEDMLTTVIEARRRLSSTSDLLQLKILVEKLDVNLNTITRVFDLLVAQLQPYRNRTNIESVISRLIKLKADIPKTISLSFFKSSIQQNLVGLRFLLVAQICHKKLCFSNIKSSVWSLHDDACATSPARQEAGLLVEGTALQSISLGSLIRFPAGGMLKMFLTRDHNLIVTTFQGIVNLLGLTKNTTVKMTGNELSFGICGPILGGFEALIKVKAQIDNVVDWNSIVFAVEGTMNKSSRLHTLLENMITNETAMEAKEATQRIANAQAVLNNAKRNAELAKDVLKSKQSSVEELRIKKETKAEDLRMARFRYHQAKADFNSIFYFHQKERLLCEIQECNYTCLNGCVVPDLCQNSLIIAYLEQHCETLTSTVKVREVQTQAVTKTSTIPSFKTIYTGDCGTPSTGEMVIGAALVGKDGDPVGAALSDSLFGCSYTYERVPDMPLMVEYNETISRVEEVDQTIKEEKCTDHTVKMKPNGSGPPYQCCKQYNCQTKVLDPQCNINSKECEDSMHNLKIKMNTTNKSLQSRFHSLHNAVKKVKEATFSYENARIEHQNAVTLLKQVEARMKQRLLAVEITNTSLFRVGRMVDFGLKIAQAMNASNSKKIVHVGEMEFSFSGNTKQFVVQCNASTFRGQRTPVSFLVDFDQLQRSVSSASNTIIGKLYPRRNSMRRTAPGDSATLTRRLHSSFIDYRYACLFTNKTHLYLRSMCQSLGDLIASFKVLNLNLSTGFYELERVRQIVNASSSIFNISSVNVSAVYPNSSFVTEYLEMIQFLKDENAGMTNDSSRSWNDTLESWRVFLEIWTSYKEFEECSGTQDCIEFLFGGAKEFYEFEDSPRALEIKEALPLLLEVIKSLTTEVLSVQEAEQALNRAAFLLNKTRDDSVLCGGTPRITSSSQGEVILLPGESLSLKCSAEKEENLTYAWRRNDELIGKSTNGTFYVGDVTKDNEGAYVCIVSNNKGSTLSNVTIVKVYSKPRITQHPQAQRIVFRSQIPATFICNATSDPPPTFQWFFQSMNSSAIKINETKPVLYIANPNLLQEGYYHCEASNDHGAAVSQRARLDVLNYTVGLPRLLISFNITTYCWLTSNSSNSSAQGLLPCDHDSTHALPPSLDKNLTDSIRHSLASSLDASIKLISSANNSKSSVAFIIVQDKGPWRKENFTSYIKIVETIAITETNMITKLEQFNSYVFNKTFKVPWNKTTLLGERGSILVYPLSPECPEGQFLRKNGFICGKLLFLSIVLLTSI